MYTKKTSKTPIISSPIPATSFGFTLIEVVIALAILSIAMIPLVNIIYRNNSLVKAELEVTGMCILEQEILVNKCNPGLRLPDKRQIINNEEWITSSEITGNDIHTITMTVKKLKKECGKVVFLENTKK